MQDSSPAPPGYTFEMLAGKYVELRNRKSDLTKQYDASCEQLDVAMDTIKQELNRMFNEQGLDSVRTPNGTVYRQLKTVFQVRDASALQHAILASGNIALLQNRLASRAVEEYKAENNGDLPPGVHQEQEYTVSIRKA